MREFLMALWMACGVIWAGMFLSAHWTAAICVAGIWVLVAYTYVLVAESEE